jgi:hypothetical protein
MTEGHLERTVGEAMAEKLDPSQVVTFEELLQMRQHFWSGALTG